MNPLFVKRYFKSSLGGLAFVGLMLFVQITDIHFIKSLQQRLEWVAYDLRLNATLNKNNKPDPRIVIVDIDEKSLKAEGHWPWSREKMARLTENLFAEDVAVVAFDIVFAEPEANIAQKILQKMDSEASVSAALVKAVPQFDYDGLFAQSLAGHDAVLGYAFNDGSLLIGELPAELPIAAGTVVSKTSIKHMGGSYTANLPVLQQAAQHAGFFNADLDADGVLRQAPLIVRHGAEIYASLSLEVARVFYGIDSVQIHTEPQGDIDAVDYIAIGKQRIPTDGQGRVIVPYRGKYGSFPYISATDILHGTINKQVLQNTIVLVGTTATGLFDSHATPMQSSYPGVEVHANVIAGLLDNRFPVQPSWADGANFFTLLLMGLILALVLPLLSPLRLISVTILTAVSFVVFNVWMWQAHGLVLFVATPLVLVLLLAATNAVYGFSSESHERSYLKGMFGQYVPKQLVEEMSRNPESLGFDGDSREMTVLFADIRDFTTVSEALSANELKRLLNEFFNSMTRIIFNRHGTIDKYVGDMVMAFWGAPLSDEHHRTYAIEASLEMLAAINELNRRLKIMNLPEVAIGIGINTGIMNVGNMGSDFRRAYTVIGDAVNLASRLEGLTKFYGVGLIAGEQTRQDQNDFIFRRLDAVKVKGKTQAVIIFEPLCRRVDASPELLAELALHEQALALYLARQWEPARQLFLRLHDQWPKTKLYSIYLKRLESLQDVITDTEWDGSYEHTSK